MRDYPALGQCRCCRARVRPAASPTHRPDLKLWPNVFINRPIQSVGALHFVRTQAWQCGTAFNVHYPPRSIIEVGSFPVYRTRVRQAQGAEIRAIQWLRTNSKSTENAIRVEELARLVAQADPCGESTPADNRFREETDEQPGPPPAPLLPADLNARKQECEFGDYRDERPSACRR
jgi:hypothetical protein